MLLVFLPYSVIFERSRKGRVGRVGSGHGGQNASLGHDRLGLQVGTLLAVPTLR